MVRVLLIGVRRLPREHRERRIGKPELDPLGGFVEIASAAVGTARPKDE